MQFVSIVSKYSYSMQYNTSKNNMVKIILFCQISTWCFQDISTLYSTDVSVLVYAFFWGNKGNVKTLFHIVRMSWEVKPNLLKSAWFPTSLVAGKTILVLKPTENDWNLKYWNWQSILLVSSGHSNDIPTQGQVCCHRSTADSVTNGIVQRCNGLMDRIRLCFDWEFIQCTGIDSTHPPYACM